MRYALPLCAALLAVMPALAAAQQQVPSSIRTISESQPQQAAPSIRSISENQPAEQRAPLDPTAFCYFADRAYSLGARMTDMVCAQAKNSSPVIYSEGKNAAPRLEWEQVKQ